MSAGAQENLPTGGAGTVTPRVPPGPTGRAFVTRRWRRAAVQQAQVAAVRDPPRRDLGPLPLSVRLADQRVAEAAGGGLRQQADPATNGSGTTPATRRRSPATRSSSLCPTCRSLHWFWNSVWIGLLAALPVDLLERDRRVRLRLLPLPAPQLLLRAGARDDDASGRGDDDPGLPDLERADEAHGRGRCARLHAEHRSQHAVPALGAEPVRQRVLHLPAAAVLPRDPTRALRGGADGRRQLLVDVPADRAPACQAGADRRRSSSSSRRAGSTCSSR